MNANFRIFSHTIAIGQTLIVNRSGDFFGAIAANGTFSVGFSGGSQTPFFAGLEYEMADGAQFTSVEITNTSGDVLAVEFSIGSGGVRDGRLTVTGTLSSRDQPADVLTTGAAVSAVNAATTLMAAANPARKEVLIINTGAATVYIGGSATATAAQGIPVLGGQSLVLNTSAAIYARNDSGAAVAVSVTELEFST